MEMLVLGEMGFKRVAIKHNREQFLEIQELLQQKADYSARLQLIPYEGTPEIKERNGKKFLYVRKRVGGKLTSTYVDLYSQERI